MSKTLTDFRKAVLERLHGCSYEDAIKIETENYYRIYENISLLGENDPLRHPSQVKTMPITLGRLMAALGTLRTEILISHGVMVRFYTDDLGGFYWKLLRGDKTECDETDQDEETLLALTNILR